MKTVLALAMLLVASTLAADGTHVYPLGPTTATPVEVHYRSACRARSHSVVRDGNDITVTIRDPQCPAVLPIPLVEKVQLGALPAGTYQLSVQQEHQPFFVTGTVFVVRPGGPKPFELHPSAVAANANTPIRMSGVTCGTANCSDVTVRVDGEPVGPLTFTPDGAIWFDAPNHEDGLLADVTVQAAGSVVTSPGALYYSFFSSERDHAAYEPILFPVISSSDGAHGSRWRSEATVSNPAPWPVDADYTLHAIGPCVQDCDPPLEPKSIQTFGHGYPHGTVFWAPRSEAAALSLSLRVRDVSRHDQGYGTQIPVVRERDFFHGENVHLLDVPLDPRYRVKVRIYMIDPVLAPLPNGIVTIRRGAELLRLPFTFTRYEGGLRIEPWYAEVDLPQGAAGERVNLEIEMPLDATGWAFASVTNNETQQVTIVAPH